MRSRVGSVLAVLALLAQLNADRCWLVTSLGGTQEVRVVARELEGEGVSTRYCKVWEGVGVPAAWILHAGEFVIVSVCLLALCWSLSERMPWRRWTFDSDSLAPTF